MSIYGNPVWVQSGGGVGLPEFTYTGTYQTIDDGNDNWRIKFTSSGTLIFTKLNGAGRGIDVFLVGGGGGGKKIGGGGGYTKTVGGVHVNKGVEYPVTVGAGGATESNGNASSAFGESAGGGYSNGNGGSGGGGPGTYNYGGAGGSNGSNGGKGRTNSGETAGGTGQGTSTREFWTIDQNTSATLYAGGGGGGLYINTAGNTGGAGGAGGGGRGGGSNNMGTHGQPGTANTGGGGGGGRNETGGYGGAGGSGIVIIRNKRS